VSTAGVSDVSAGSAEPAQRSGEGLTGAELDAFVAARTATLELEDGTTITVRPATRHDRRYLLEGLSRLSDRSVYTRFLRPMPDLSERELEYLLAVDQTDHVAWAAFDEDGRPVAVARYIRETSRPTFAEAAVTVIDDFQRRGIGTVLVRLLAESAMDNGIEHFTAYVGIDNSRLGAALEGAGARATDRDEYATTFIVDLPLEASLDDSVLVAALKAAAHPDQP